MVGNIKYSLIVPIQKYTLWEVYNFNNLLTIKMSTYKTIITQKTFKYGVFNL